MDVTHNDAARRRRCLLVEALMVNTYIVHMFNMAVTVIGPVQEEHTE